MSKAVKNTDFDAGAAYRNGAEYRARLHAEFLEQTDKESQLLQREWRELARRVFTPEEIERLMR